MRAQSVDDLWDHLGDVIHRVERHDERVIVTRKGCPVAVLISPADLAALEETIDVLSDPEARADIREADAAYSRGDVVRGAAALRAVRPCQRTWDAAAVNVLHVPIELDDKPRSNQR